MAHKWVFTGTTFRKKQANETIFKVDVLKLTKHNIANTPESVAGLLPLDILCTGGYCVLKGKLIIESHVDRRSSVQFPLFRLLCAHDVGVHASAEPWSPISIVKVTAPYNRTALRAAATDMVGLMLQCVAGCIFSRFSSSSTIFVVFLFTSSWQPACRHH